MTPRVIIFFLFVASIAGVFLASALVAHFHPGRHRYASAWWAGIILAVISITYLSPMFTDLPRDIDINNPAISQIDWPSLTREAIQIDLIALFAGILISFFVLELIYRSDPPTANTFFNLYNITSMVLLFLSFSSLTLTLYIFFIRDFTYIFFSVIIGIIEGILLFVAFRGKAVFEKMVL
jgi:hypothetical protein